ncbi:MAG: pyruvate dehydrogenase E1 component [Planctomycetota bacterium]|jgi:pyruvate dehydrogenase E1 component
MITKSRPITAASSTQERIVYRALAQAVAMIHLANNRKTKEKGDPKVGGHPASCASSLHLLAALHLEVRRPGDYVCCKPHASPADHALHNLLQLFRHNAKVNWFNGASGEDWFNEEEAMNCMEMLRAFPREDRPQTFQSYHAASDPDNFHFLPSGTVGIPPVNSAYLALAYRYARDHGWEVPEDTHFWSMMGDSEFREGSLYEAMPDIAERNLGSVTWIVDYNRQNLDGTRLTNESGLELHDCDRIEQTAIANGWATIQVRHGKLRMQAFSGPGGQELQQVLETGLTDFEFQMLVLKRNAAPIRAALQAIDPATKPAVDALDDESLLRVMLDLGGNCYDTIKAALEASREDPDEPCMIIAHTMKGWGLECLADPANHSSLPKKAEVEALLEANGLSMDEPFRWFAEGTPEANFLAARRDEMRAGQDAAHALVARNQAKVAKALDEQGGMPDSVGINLSLMRNAHTQWAWGQMAGKLVRIGSNASEGEDRSPLTEDERAWAVAAEYFMTLSPDVGTSTNISGAMNARVYGIEPQDPDLKDKLGVQYKHPDMVASEGESTRHIRFEIAEAIAMSAVGSLGMMKIYTGIPFFPVMTVYDFFLKRALDQLYYDLYWGAEFVIMGTPAGVSLSAEGAQHSWKSDLQMPNLITWEPAFAREMDWILSDALSRQAQNNNKGRSGVLIRGTTRELQQDMLLKRVGQQLAYKASAPAGALKPAGAGDEWGAATDEASVAPVEEVVLMERVRLHCLAGAWRLVSYTGYAGYEPGDNVVQILAMGALIPEAVAASDMLLERGVFADVIVVSSPELLLGILGEQNNYQHLRVELGVNDDLHAVAEATDSSAGLVSIAARRVPIVSVADGEAGLLDNAGSVVGVPQRTLGVRRFSKCGRPSDIYTYQELDADSIVKACGRALAETALSNLRISRSLLEEQGGRLPADRANWRELWPEPLGK